MLYKAVCALALAAQANAVPALKAEDLPSNVIQFVKTDSATDVNALAHITGSPEIVFAVVTSHAHHADKAKSVLDTWCSDIYACAFFSDEHNPSNEPTTSELKLTDHGFKPEDNVDSQVGNQLRHIVALKKARDMVMDPTHADKLGKMKWLVLCTDDTYIFYHNLAQTLSSFNSTDLVYTGNVIAGTEDEEGNGIVNIGGGAAFSKAALLEMSNLGSCISAARPGGKWWGLMPDSIVGECAYEAGVPTETPPHGGAFNQLGCTASEGHPVHHCGAQNELSEAAAAEGDEQEDGDYHDTAEGVDQCSCAGTWDKPASFHPVMERESMQLLWTTFAESSTTDATNVSVVKAPGTVMTTMTPDQKHWFYRGYDDGVRAGKTAGWQEAHQMRRDARHTGEQLGKVKGSAKGKNIGYRHGKAKGKSIGMHRGKQPGIREGEHEAIAEAQKDTGKKGESTGSDSSSTSESVSSPAASDSGGESSGGAGSKSDVPAGDSSAPPAKAVGKKGGH